LLRYRPGASGPRQDHRGHCQVDGAGSDRAVLATGCGSVVAWGQAVADRPTTSFQVANLVCISCRYPAAVSRCRRGRKCGDIALNADRNRCAPPGERNFFIARSRALVG
jgi:ribosomal protein L37E